MALYKSFEELPVWQQSMKLAEQVFKMTANGKLNKEYELKRQIHKSVISISSNIAEGFERGSKKELIQFLYIAKGSCGELRSQILLARNLNFISVDYFPDICNFASEVSKQIAGFINYLKLSKYKGQKFQNV